LRKNLDGADQVGAERNFPHMPPHRILKVG
jgi:hypothetical protein